MSSRFKKILPANFPSLLKEINDPPAELYVEGNLPKKTRTNFSRLSAPADILVTAKKPVKN